ncbi:MAG: camphor resistance protein CrcB [Deltaproteobacteria bacterium RIFOXYD12_FULL_57_12]|nr:MAG: camphor resistance protein CrcB [Deltaproteobacteria bacterium RIFOXYD12_FULL_57_12]
MFNFLAILLGGGIGAIGRHILFLAVQRLADPLFPAGTLAVNLLGSLLIGFLWSLFEEIPFTHAWRLFVFTGLLGGFTTFSTFTNETAQLIETGAWKTAFVYVALSNILGVAAVFCGALLYRRLGTLAA